MLCFGKVIFKTRFFFFTLNFYSEKDAISIQ